MVRLLGLVLGVLGVGLANGLSACLDPKDDEYRCQAGKTKMNLQYCEILDKDHDALMSCFDNAGREMIEYVELNFNNLTTLPPGLFEGMSKLHLLRLAHNSLFTLPAGLFEDCRDVWGVYLEYNSLVSLPPGFFEGLDTLTFLRLDGNSLTTLPSGLFAPLRSMRYLDMVSNPKLQCVPPTTWSPGLVYASSDRTSPGLCACPKMEACEGCEPGVEGYTCAGTSEAAAAAAAAAS
ncbi:unnamed protein product [Scytosiphon promiscuus]